MSNEHAVVTVVPVVVVVAWLRLDRTTKLKDLHSSWHQFLNFILGFRVGEVFPCLGCYYFSPYFVLGTVSVERALVVKDICTFMGMLHS